MSYINLANPANVNGSHKELFEQINGAFGTVPNMFKAIGNSEAALQAMFGFFGALGKGKLSKQLGEQVAVRIADINRCEYCLAAHTVLGQGAGATAEAMSAAQVGKSNDTRTQAALVFAEKVVKSRAQLSQADVTELKNAGFDDEEVAELLAHIALNIFTNYTNVAFDVEVDFPKVALT